MKFFKFLMFGTILTCGLMGQAKEYLEQEDISNTGVKEEAKKGCGYDRSLVVASMIGNPPFGWVEYDENNEKNPYESFGLGRDVLDKISQKLGITYTSTGFRSFEETTLALKKGEIDLLLGSYFMPRELGMGTEIIKPGYTKNIFTVFFKKGQEFPVSSYDDLIGKKGIIRREEQIYPLIKSKIENKLDLVQVSGAKKAFEMLLNGEADYLLGGLYSQEAELRRYKVNREITHASKGLDGAYVFFVFSTQTSCYRELKEKFKEILSDAEFSQLNIDIMTRQSIDNWGERFREEDGLITKKAEMPEEELMPPVPPQEENN